MKQNVPVQNLGNYRGTEWQILAEWRDGGGIDGMYWSTDLQFRNERVGWHTGWTPDALLTWPEEMGRPIPKRIQKAFDDAKTQLIPKVQCAPDVV